MDTRVCRGAVALARDVDVLLCESTYLHEDAALAQAYGHLTARQAGELAAEAGARRLVLTHFSRRYGDDVEQFAAQARRAAGPDVEVVAARDLDRIALPARRSDRPTQDHEFSSRWVARTHNRDEKRRSCWTRAVLGLPGGPPTGS
jgi:ribonuclease Z